MISKVQRNPRAEQDVIDIWFYIAVENRSRVNADRLLKRFDIVFEKLAKNPGMGILKSQYGAGLYQFRYGHYLIFYRIITGGIEIVRVLHGARNIPEII